MAARKPSAHRACTLAVGWFPTIAEQSIWNPDECGGLPHYGGALLAFVSIVIPASMTSVFSTLNPTSRKTRST